MNETAKQRTRERVANLRGLLQDVEKILAESKPEKLPDPSLLDELTTLRAQNATMRGALARIAGSDPELPNAFGVLVKAAIENVDKLQQERLAWAGVTYDLSRFLGCNPGESLVDAAHRRIATMQQDHSRLEQHHAAIGEALACARQWLSMVTCIPRGSD